MTSDLVVVDYHRDPFTLQYRLTVGYVEEREFPLLDENGEPTYDMVPGGPVEESEEPELVRGDPRTTVDRVLVPVEDFVFSAYDERWEGLDDEEIAAEQKRLVLAALVERERVMLEEAERVEERVPMPGVGEPL
jgi:hypothetical protein